MPKHTAVWIDHNEARVFRLDPKAAEQDEPPAMVTLTHTQEPMMKPEGNKRGAKSVKRFFKKVGRSLEGKGDILLVGPATTKLAFLRFAHKHHRSVDKRIVGIETVEHPTGAGFLSYAKGFFAARGDIVA